MKRLLVLFAICIFIMWTNNVKSSIYTNSKRKRHWNLMKRNNLNNDNRSNYSFLMLHKENDEKTNNDSNNNTKKEKEGDDNNNSNNNNNSNSNNNSGSNNVSGPDKKNAESNSNEKKNEESNANEKKNEENNANEKKQEEDNSNEKKNEENSSKQTNESLPPEKKINKDNLLEYGTHDKDGNFIPSYKTLTDEILSINNSLERASNYLKIGCSHILKTLEFIPESKLSTQYIKVDTKNVYLKDISTECQNIFFSIEKLTMTIIVLNSKLNKFIYVSDK
ncbi:conserved Plasmodium protein, unknown function [Plasmodium malariae]|uniref:Rhoptry associated adhesin n=1 Tax=Plasmodium malariae TaxID=5858 RepID=A0A1C3KY89_PLAMA|nr:conserved Plasmodium protein, unknown function [Plasmodium malariae]